LFGEKKRIHLREIHTSVLAMRFALETSTHLKTELDNSIKGRLGSFCVWAKEHKLNDYDLDPNYL
jgi:hypothetical protein